MRFYKPLIFFPFCILMLSTSLGFSYAKDKYKMEYSNMDVNHDGIVTRDEWHGDNNIFHGSDWNGDGVLSGDEAPGGARRGDRYDRNHSEDRFRDLDKNLDSGVSPNEWNGGIEAFNRLDDNRDGVLAWMEFVKIRVEGTDRFTELDRDSDGYISRNELNKNSETFNHLDKNHDGHLSRTEYGKK